MALIHRHVWSIKGVQPVQITEPFDPYRVIATRTDVLYVCLKCQKVKIKTIKGVWTREQLR